MGRSGAGQLFSALAAKKASTVYITLICCHWGLFMKDSPRKIKEEIRPTDFRRQGVKTVSFQSGAGP